MTSHYKPSAKERAQNRIENGIMYTPLGRELCITREAYQQRTRDLAARQEWKCALCTRIMSPPTFDHEDGRGMGGAHRNDAMTHMDGSPCNAALCEECNMRKGSRRYQWRNGAYVPQER